MVGRWTFFLCCILIGLSTSYSQSSEDNCNAAKKCNAEAADIIITEDEAQKKIEVRRPSNLTSAQLPSPTVIQQGSNLFIKPKFILSSPFTSYKQGHRPVDDVLVNSKLPIVESTVVIEKPKIPQLPSLVVPPPPPPPLPPMIIPTDVAADNRIPLFPNQPHVPIALPTFPKLPIAIPNPPEVSIDLSHSPQVPIAIPNPPEVSIDLPHFPQVPFAIPNPPEVSINLPHFPQVPFAIPNPSEVSIDILNHPQIPIAIPKPHDIIPIPPVFPPLWETPIIVEKPFRPKIIPEPPQLPPLTLPELPIQVIVQRPPEPPHIPLPSIPNLPVHVMVPRPIIPIPNNPMIIPNQPIIFSPIIPQMSGCCQNGNDSVSMASILNDMYQKFKNMMNIGNTTTTTESTKVSVEEDEEEEDEEEEDDDEEEPDRSQDNKTSSCTQQNSTSNLQVVYPTLCVQGIVAQRVVPNIYTNDQVQIYVNPIPPYQLAPYNYYYRK